MARSLEFSGSDRPRDEEVHVTLPCSPDHFAEFIAGLLGRPQTIRRHFPMSFDIQQAELESFHHLLVQRITQQNEATLVQFVAVVHFHDRSSIRINSFDDFCSYNEVRPLRSIAIMMSWTFLIRFQDRRQPEKQAINVEFVTPEARASNMSRAMYPALEHKHEPGVVGLEINYTARTWANDIDNLVKGHIETLEISDNVALRLIVGQKIIIGCLLGIMMLVAGIFAGVEAQSHFSSIRQNELKELVDEALPIREVLVEAVRIATTTKSGNPSGLFVISGLTGGLLIGFVTVFAANQLRRTSTVVLTGESRKRVAQNKIQFRRRVAAYIMVVAMDVAAGLGIAVFAARTF